MRRSSLARDVRIAPMGGVRGVFLGRGRVFVAEDMLAGQRLDRRHKCRPRRPAIGLVHLAGAPWRACLVCPGFGRQAQRETV